MSSLRESLALFDELKFLFEQGHPPVDRCNMLMNKLKVIAYSDIQTLNSHEEMQHLMFSREIFEYGALLSINTGDLPSFERYVAQLKTYYYDYATKLPTSQWQYCILGLNLMRLLSKNNREGLDEFHTELELIPLDMHKNIFIKKPIQLEQYMMEGAYNKVLKAKADIPSQHYSYFINKLTETLRDEIAECIERAYSSSMKVGEVMKQLEFGNFEEMKMYAQQRGWILTENQVHFNKVEETMYSETPANFSLQLIRQTLYYAKELERII